MANIHHSSATNEHYTPGKYVEAAHLLMRGIDLDPASCTQANETVKARHYYTKEDNGFGRDWFGSVWLNPPGGICDEDGRIVITAKKATKTQPARLSCAETGECGLPPGPQHKHKSTTSTAKAWWFKLVSEYFAGNVTSAVFLAFNLEMLQTTQTPCFNSAAACGSPLPSIHYFPMCFPSTRIRFFTPDKGKLKEGGSPTHGNVIVYLPPNDKQPHEKFEALFSPHGQCIWPSDARVREG